MQIEYTGHAEERIKLRKILKIWIEEAIKWPDLTIRLNERKYIIRKKLNGLSIEIVFIKDKTIKILTTYWI